MSRFVPLALSLEYKCSKDKHLRYAESEQEAITWYLVPESEGKAAAGTPFAHLSLPWSNG